MLINEWRRFKGWAVLEFFLWEGGKIHLKGLSRKLKISPSTAQHYLVLYESEGLLEKEKIGNLSIYRLIDTPLTNLLKRFYIISRLKEGINRFVQQNRSIITIALYGSSASGEYDKDSDIDLLVVSQNKDIKLDAIKRLEEDLNREIKMEILSVGELRHLELKKDNFYKSVMEKHVILYGAAL